ncbi:MAG TPA: CRISPR-associated protein Csx3 [Anaerolineae bacterium]|nr:CRISPR-associated protein Csx3 [Anaerolineae bacterium]
MKPFPAVMIGGPPHSGKSVLTYSLSQLLRQRQIAHYVLRTCPDGEGDWANETDQHLVRQIRVKGKYTRRWIARICRDISKRHLPLIVDVGGKPKQWQEIIFGHCTHAILLTPNPQARLVWEKLVEAHNVPVIAALHSTRDGQNRVEKTEPILQGCISNLERGLMAQGPVFNQLVDLLSAILTYEAEELRRRHVTMAPTELTVELRQVGAALSWSNNYHRWLPGNLPSLLDYVPAQTPLGIYDRGPNWVYTALALHAYPAALFQFDVRLGWIAPPKVRLLPVVSDPTLRVRLMKRGTYAIIDITIIKNYLDYEEAFNLTLPSVSPDQGIVISGKLPLWLWTAIAVAYQSAPWVAVFQPQLGHRAIIIASKQAGVQVGRLIECKLDTV